MFSLKFSSPIQFPAAILSASIGPSRFRERAKGGYIIPRHDAQGIEPLQAFREWKTAEAVHQLPLSQSTRLKQGINESSANIGRSVVWFTSQILGCACLVPRSIILFDLRTSFVDHASLGA